MLLLLLLLLLLSAAPAMKRFCCHTPSTLQRGH